VAQVKNYSKKTQSNLRPQLSKMSDLKQVLVIGGTGAQGIPVVKGQYIILLDSLYANDES
jgi:hypothetical protein